MELTFKLKPAERAFEIHIFANVKQWFMQKSTFYIHKIYVWKSDHSFLYYQHNLFETAQ